MKKFIIEIQIPEHPERIEDEIKGETLTRFLHDHEPTVLEHYVLTMTVFQLHIDLLKVLERNIKEESQNKKINHFIGIQLANSEKFQTMLKGN